MASLMSNTSGNAIQDAMADVVNKTAAPFQNLADPKASVLDKAKGVVGAVAGLSKAPTDFLDDAFARGTNVIAKALPSLPAATIGMVVLGIPHTHTHPPALPVPLPGIGPIMTGCVTVVICGIAAARCGDFGIGPTCGSVAPVFEIMTGSSKVFIGGQRAARMLDITRQCTPAGPKAAGATKAAAAAGKMSKAMATAQKVMGGVGKVSMALGVISNLDKIATADAAATAAQAAEDAALDAKEVNAAAVAEAQGDAASAAGEAAAAALALVMMGMDMAMNAAAAALGALQGKDPGAPPCIGAVMLGVPTVLVGGFPMPSWSNIAKGLKKLVNAIRRGRRGGAARGRPFCLKCM